MTGTADWGSRAVLLLRRTEPSWPFLSFTRCCDHVFECAGSCNKNYSERAFIVGCWRRDGVLRSRSPTADSRHIHHSITPPEVGGGSGAVAGDNALALALAPPPAASGMPSSPSPSSSLAVALLSSPSSRCSIAIAASAAMPWHSARSRVAREGRSAFFFPRLSLLHCFASAWASASSVSGHCTSCSKPRLMAYVELRQGSRKASVRDRQIKRHAQATQRAVRAEVG